MAGMEGFPGREALGQSSFQGEGDSHLWTNKFMEGDPRRPTSLTRSKLARKTGGYIQEPGEGGSGGEQPDKFAGIGIGVSGLVAENLACHPFVILRRQCQVNVEGHRYHTTPITILPVLVNLNRWQGVSVLWKGIGSSLTIKGMTLGVEDCLSKVTPWPKTIDQHSSLKLIGQHLLLKSVSAALITPFYSASLVETVQSDIASEKPGVFDVFREGLVRLVSWSDPRCGRMLPVWVLVPPQVIHSVVHYIVSTVVQGVWLQVLKATHREYQKLTGAVSRDPQLSNLPGLSQYQSQAAALTGNLVADTLLYPLETVLHRLHLQGTRSIIDNLDSGREVVPILTRYEGVSDCFSTILREEGCSGLFKGFGAVLLQYAVHFVIIKFSSKVISQLAQVFSDTRLPFPDPRQGAPVPAPVPVPDPQGVSGHSSLRDSPAHHPQEREVTSSPQAGRGGDGPLVGPTEAGGGVGVAYQEPAESVGPPALQEPRSSPGRGVDGSLPSGGGTGLPSGGGTGLPSGSGTGLPSGGGTGLPSGVGTGLPSLLSFSKTSTTPTQRRILPDQDYDLFKYDKGWRSLDNI